MEHESRIAQDSTEAAVAGRRSAFQFSLGGGLFLVTLTCFVLVSVTQVHLPLTRVLLSVVSVMIGIGVWAQSRDISRASAACLVLPDAAKNGWTFAVRWRRAVVVLLVAYWCFECVLYANSLIPIYEDRFWSYLGTCRGALLYLLLVIGLSTAPGCMPLEPRQRSATLIVLGWLTTLVWFGLAFLTSGLIAGLVHIAIAGVENAQPYRALGDTIHEVRLLDLAAGYATLAWIAPACLALALAAVACLAMGATSPADPTRCRKLFVGHLVCLMLAAGLAIWIRSWGLAAASPYLAAEPFADVTPYLAILSAVLVAVVSGCMANRLATVESEQPLMWRASGYTHEGRIVCGLCLVSVVIEKGWFSFGLLPARDWTGSLIRMKWLTEIVEEPTSYLGVCLIVVAAVGLLGHRRKLGAAASTCGRQLEWRPFFVCWITSAITLLITAEAVLWTSFVFWLW